MLRHLEVQLVKVKPDSTDRNSPQMQDREEKKELIQHCRRDSITSIDSLAPISRNASVAQSPL